MGALLEIADTDRKNNNLTHTFKYDDINRLELADTSSAIDPCLPMTAGGSFADGAFKGAWTSAFAFIFSASLCMGGVLLPDCFGKIKRSILAAFYE
ncbi:MAG: hypothetical protein HKP58_15290 [Desulfatitalea sp.]|nr:hypothetical protein [Desulfatitalea sp.]NNK01774.1 hypothetical protein [Desulfatitalea sp.]